MPRPPCTVRALEPHEVTFTVSVEADDIPIRGNVMATEDDAADREAEDEIFDRLQRGDETAWCCILVKAEWKGFRGHDSLGGVSLRPGLRGSALDSELESWVASHAMREEALDHLNTSVAKSAAVLSELVTLKATP